MSMSSVSVSSVSVSGASCRYGGWGSGGKRDQASIQFQLACWRREWTSATTVWDHVAAKKEPSITECAILIFRKGKAARHAQGCWRSLA
eukprot:scaffold10537_cov122-Isochrysis_galbana.AAC.3